MVDADYRNIQGKRESAGGGPCHTETRAEAGTHGECDEVYILQRYPCIGNSLLYIPRHHLSMVVGRLPGVKTSLRRPIHVDHVGEDLPLRIDHAYPQSMGRSLDTERYHRTADILGHNKPL